jgi:hypothetical protein
MTAKNFNMEDIKGTWFEQRRPKGFFDEGGVKCNSLFLEWRPDQAYSLGFYPGGVRKDTGELFGAKDNNPAEGYIGCDDSGRGNCKLGMGKIDPIFPQVPPEADFEVLSFDDDMLVLYGCNNMMPMMGMAIAKWQWAQIYSRNKNPGQDKIDAAMAYLRGMVSANGQYDIDAKFQVIEHPDDCTYNTY